MLCARLLFSSPFPSLPCPCLPLPSLPSPSLPFSFCLSCTSVHVLPSHAMFLPDIFFSLPSSRPPFPFPLPSISHRCLLLLSSRCDVFAFVVFRCDVLILLAPIGLSLLLTRSIGFFFAVFTCVLTGIASLMLTVSVDSVLWQRFPLWPEGTVLFFNTALNKSSEWGVSSPHWYFTSALPRALLLAYPLSFLGPILDRHMLRFFLPALTFVGLYSFLPHKELRFLFPGLPLFLLSAARALVRLQVLLRATGGSSSISRVVGRIARPLTLLALAVSCLLSSLFALASYRNYPGGAAAILLQQKVGHEPGSVHVDLLPAMTGFSRFTQLPAPWSYSKQEGLTHSQLSQSNFSYLLSAHPSVPSYEPVTNASGFVRMRISTSTLFRMPPLRYPFPVLSRDAGSVRQNSSGASSLTSGAGGAGGGSVWWREERVEGGTGGRVMSQNVRQKSSGASSLTSDAGGAGGLQALQAQAVLGGAASGGLLLRRLRSLQGQAVLGEAASGGGGCGYTGGMNISARVSPRRPRSRASARRAERGCACSWLFHVLLGEAGAGAEGEAEAEEGAEAADVAGETREAEAEGGGTEGALPSSAILE
ncbi:unnamed protein product [Closterium sp. NIES-54]